MRPGTWQLWILIAAFAQAPPALSQPPPLWGKLSPGPFGVGFTALFTYDHSRTFRPPHVADGSTVAGVRSRYIQGSLWYPTVHPAGSSAMTFEHYVLLLSREEGPGTGSDTARDNAVRLFARSLRRWLGEFPDPRAVDRLLATRTAAQPDGPRAKGNFPLLLLAQGSSQSALTHAVLCEYLASHGFIVATVPSIGPRSREMPFEPSGAEAQARDLEFLLSLLVDRGIFSSGARGVIGFSFGGYAALIEAMRNPDVQVLVSLDSNIGFRSAPAFFSGLPDFDISRMRIPLLHMRQQDSPGISDRLIDSLRYCDRTVVRVNGLTHFDFSSLGMLAALVPGLTKNARAGVQAGYEAVCTHALAFLERHLRGGPAQSGAGPELPGDPPGRLSSRHMDAEPAAPTYEVFVEIIREKGIAEARTLYERERRRSPGDNLFAEATLNRLGYELLQDYMMTGEAIEVFRWNAEAYPASFNVYDSLGEAYLAAGDTSLAAANYRKSLELNPQNRSAQEALERLGER